MVALIVLGVVVFLLVDAYILYRVFRGHRAADDLGTVGVPGELAVMLQPGKVKLTYAESRRSQSFDDDIQFWVPQGVAVSVISPSGEQLEIKGPGFKGMGESVSTGPGFSRTLIGTIQVTETGEHTVTVTGEAGADAVEPRVVVGK